MESNTIIYLGVACLVILIMIVIYYGLKSGKDNKEVSRLNQELTETIQQQSLKLNELFINNKIQKEITKQHLDKQNKQEAVTEDQNQQIEEFNQLKEQFSELEKEKNELLAGKDKLKKYYKGVLQLSATELSQANRAYEEVSQRYKVLEKCNKDIRSQREFYRQKMSKTTPSTKAAANTLQNTDSSDPSNKVTSIKGKLKGL